METDSRPISSGFHLQQPADILIHRPPSPAPPTPPISSNSSAKLQPQHLRPPLRLHPPPDVALRLSVGFSPFGIVLLGCGGRGGGGIGSGQGGAGFVGLRGGVRGWVKGGGGGGWGRGDDSEVVK